MKEPKHRRLAAAVMAVRKRWMTIDRAAALLEVSTAEIAIELTRGQR